MIDRKELLKDLQALLRKEIEPDLRARSELPEIERELKAEFEKAKKAKRTALNYTDWRSDDITQIGVAWVLSTVFIRFLEDNRLIDPPRLSGHSSAAGAEGENRLQRARDERDIYVQANPEHSFRQYILSIVDDLATLSGGKEVFGKNNLIHQQRDWLSNDAARELYNFWQKIDPATGKLIHDFTDDAPDGQPFDTRFLGDLYQDLSEAARKKYALLQTPDFVEEFILDRTLEPALDEFGLVVSSQSSETDNQQLTTDSYFKMIDPACGSGHFLLGAFDRILTRWQRKEPGTKVDKLVERTLASIHGVDINPFAVAIARFRLLLAAFRACHVERLDQPIDFHLNVACGDSLYHGKHRQLMLDGIESDESHYFRTENAQELNRILQAGAYHAVVANPPYITPKDRASNIAYRRLYSTCHRQYSLGVPFVERIFGLAFRGSPSDGKDAGYTGQITANSFMKAEFGSSLIEKFFPVIDLTCVVDSSTAYVPGHGTPTVILFGRGRTPFATQVRLVKGLIGESQIPECPAEGLVWTDILKNIDRVGAKTKYVEVDDVARGRLLEHPWSIGGGGAAELKDQLDERGDKTLSDLLIVHGRGGHTGEDDTYVGDHHVLTRFRIPAANQAKFVEGGQVRDWVLEPGTSLLFPYASDLAPLPEDYAHPVFRRLWPFRTKLWERREPNGTHREIGLTWYEFSRFHPERFIRGGVVQAFIGTHNHYTYDTEGGKLYNRTAPIMKLGESATDSAFVRLTGLLNSSVVCFWLKQVCFPKGGDQIGQHGARVRRTLWDEHYNYNTTPMQTLPLVELPLTLPDRLNRLVGKLAANFPIRILSSIRNDNEAVSIRRILLVAAASVNEIIGGMIRLQEDLDWECYRLYKLIEEDLCGQQSAISDKLNTESSFGIKLGERAFEIVLARKMAAGELQTTWFERHGSSPITEIPERWPDDYKALVQRRIEVIESNPNIALIEQPEYKRRWNTEPWDSQVQRALKSSLLDRLESYFDYDGRMKEPEPEQTGEGPSPGPDSPTSPASGRGESPPPLADIRVVSVAKLADVAAKDERFMEVAQVYRDRADFDVVKLVDELVAEEQVPALPILRYKPSGLDKRKEWEQTWELQRAEDRIHVLVQTACTGALTEEAQAKQASESPGDPGSYRIIVDKLDFAELANIIVTARKESKPDDKSPECVAVVQQRIDHAVRGIAQPKISDVARLVTLEILGEIAVPPKYASADFISSGGVRYWNLRGKLDVPKERWVSFPHCQGEDQTLPIAWAGYDHLQLTRAIAAYFAEVQERGGSQDPRLVPLLAAIDRQIPWVKQWHNDIDPDFGLRLGDYFKNFINDEARNLGLTVEDIRKWTPPEKTTAKKKTNKAAKIASAKTETD